MRIVCWQTILMKYHTLFFFQKFEKMAQNVVCWQTILMKYHTLFFFQKFEKMAQNVVCCSCDCGFKG